MPVYEIKHFQGAISDDEDKGILGAFKFGTNLNVRRRIDSLIANQALKEEGLIEDSRSPSSSVSPSASISQSASPSITQSASPSTTPSSSTSSSQSTTTGISPSASLSLSPSPSPSPSNTASFSLSPSPSVSAGVTSEVKDLILWWVNATDGYSYGFGNTGWIYRRTPEGYISRVYKDPNGEIKGAEEKPDDSGRSWLIWTTDDKVHRKRIPGLDNWTDVNEALSSDIWPKGNLRSADYHTIKQIGGSAYIANRDFLALVGYDNSYTNEALDIVPGNNIKTIVERNGRSILGTYKTGRDGKGINAAIDGEYPIAQIGDQGHLFYANGQDSIAFKTLPGGGKSNPGGIVADSIAEFFEWGQEALSWISKQELKNITYIGIYGADAGYNGIYSIGREAKNKPYILNLEYALEVDEIGAITIVDDGTLIASYRDGSDFGIVSVDPNNKAVAVYEGLDFKSPIKSSERPTNWKTVEIFHAPLPTGAKIDFYYRMSKDGSFVHAQTADGEESFTTAGEVKSTFSIGAQGDIYEPRIVLTPYGNNSPEVYRVRTYFE